MYQHLGEYLNAVHWSTDLSFQMKNKHLILPIFLSIYSLVLPLTSAAQEDKRGAQSSREKGIPYVQNFGPDDYNSHIENQAIVQDQRGVMYFGNIDGVLEYDGVTWRKIVPNQATPNVYSLAVDNTNTVFVGGRSELGYLRPMQRVKCSTFLYLIKSPKTNERSLRSGRR